MILGKTYLNGTENKIYLGNTLVYDTVEATYDPVTFVGSTQASDLTTNPLTLVLPPHQIDDFAIIYGRTDDDAPILSFDTDLGWTLLDNQKTTIGRDSNNYVWYKKFESASETNPIINISVSAEHSATLHIFRNVDTLTPFDTIGKFKTETVAAQCTGFQNLPITTLSKNSCILLLSAHNGDDITSVVPPTGYSIGESMTGASFINMQQEIAYLLDSDSIGLKTPGAWGTTFSAETGDNTKYTIALKSASSPPHNVTNYFSIYDNAAGDDSNSINGWVGSNITTTSILSTDTFLGDNYAVRMELDVALTQKKTFYLTNLEVGEEYIAKIRCKGNTSNVFYNWTNVSNASYPTGLISLEWKEVEVRFTVDSLDCRIQAYIGDTSETIGDWLEISSIIINKV